MAKTVTPSKIASNAQIGKVTDKLSLALHRACLQGGPLQQIIESKGDVLISKLVDVVRKNVEAISDMITRVAHVNNSLSAKAAFVVTGRVQYLNDKIVATISNFAGGETLVTFFNPGKTLTNEQLAEEYAKRGLKPAHPSAVAKVNEDDPTFAYDYPNATVWDDSSYAAFSDWNGQQNVNVNRHDDGWFDRWWFAGVPASTKDSDT